MSFVYFTCTFGTNPTQQRIVTFFCALVAGVFGCWVGKGLNFLSQGRVPLLGRADVQAGGGAVLFIIVLVWWSPTFTGAPAPKDTPIAKYQTVHKFQKDRGVATPDAGKSSGSGINPVAARQYSVRNQMVVAMVGSRGDQQQRALADIRDAIELIASYETNNSEISEVKKWLKAVSTGHSTSSARQERVRPVGGADPNIDPVALLIFFQTVRKERWEDLAEEEMKP